MNAAKKDFTNISTGNVYRTIAEATSEQETQQVIEAAPAVDAPHTRKTYTEAEAQEFLSSLKTAGRKGVKLPRINLAFSPEVYDFVKTMSKVSGITLTEFVNKVMKQYMDEHREQYEKAIEFRNSL